MRKILLALLPLLFLVFMTQGQDYSVDWGPNYHQRKEKLTDYTLLDFDGVHYCLITRHSKKKYVQLKYNLNHELIETKKHDYKYQGSPVVFNRIAKTSSTSYAIGYHFNKCLDKINLSKRSSLKY